MNKQLLKAKKLKKRKDRLKREKHLNKTTHLVLKKKPKKRLTKLGWFLLITLAAGILGGIITFFEKIYF